MKIVLLESLGISQELLDSYVKPLKEKGYEFAAYERNDDPAVQIEEAKDADILIIANMPLKAEVINACPNLKYIDVAFTGVDHVALDAAKAKGIKVSKFYKADGSLICWYCDIVTHSYDKATDTYVFTDLLADVLVYPDGRVKVVDLDELSEANETGLLSLDDLHKALHITNALLTEVYAGRFSALTACIDAYDPALS